MPNLTEGAAVVSVRRGRAVRAGRSRVQGWVRAHRVVRRRPVEMLTEEQIRLHRPPEVPFTSVFDDSGVMVSTIPSGESPTRCRINW